MPVVFRSNSPLQITLTLASASTYRLQLLQSAGYAVTAIASGQTEPALETFPSLESGLIHLAELKARSVAATVSSGLILGCDTVGLVQGRVLGKPVDRDHAREMLRMMSGTTHDVLTGWCLLRKPDGLIIAGVEKTVITMRAWTNAEFTSYLDSGEWVGKCGAYGLQWPGDPFVVAIAGSSSNVIGVPLERLSAVFKEFPTFTQSPP